MVVTESSRSPDLVWPTLQWLTIIAVVTGVLAIALAVGSKRSRTSRRGCEATACHEHGQSGQRREALSRGVS
jgi:hypothetical protein